MTTEDGRPLTQSFHQFKKTFVNSPPRPQDSPQALQSSTRLDHEESFNFMNIGNRSSLNKRTEKGSTGETACSNM